MAPPGLGNEVIVAEKSGHLAVDHQYLVRFWSGRLEHDARRLEERLVRHGENAEIEFRYHDAARVRVGNVHAAEFAEQAEDRGRVG